MKMKRLNPLNKKSIKLFHKYFIYLSKLLPGVFSIILIYSLSFHAIIKQNMSVEDKLTKQKGFTYRSQTQRKIKHKSNFIAGNSSKEKTKRFIQNQNQELPKSTKQQIRQNNKFLQENKSSTRKKSKVAFLQCYNQENSKIKKLENAVTRKLSQYSHHILKVKKSFSKPKMEKIDQIKKKSFSAIEIKKQIKHKSKIYIEKQKVSMKENASRHLKSLHLPPDNSQNMRIQKNDLNVEQFLMVKEHMGCFQFFRRLRRKEKQENSKKKILNECKFVIKPFQNIKLKKCNSQRNKRTVNQQTGINSHQLNDLKCILELKEISQIREVSLNSQSLLENQSFQILHFLELESS